MTQEFTLATLPNEDSFLILSANPRLTQSIRQDHARLQAAAGLTRWSAPAVHTIEQWLSVIGEEMLLCGPCATDNTTAQSLTPLQEQLVFEEIIEESLSNGDELFDVAALASLAVEANRLATIWNLDLSSGIPTEEQRSFIQWRNLFHQRCRQAGWNDAASATLRLLNKLGNSRVPLPRWVIFAGLDRLTPIEETLKQTLQARGVAIGELRPTDALHSAQVTSCQDAASEILSAAHWAKAHLQSNPAHRVGIVVPNLGKCRDLVQDSFDRVFTPAVYRPAFADQPKPFNISLGLPLTNYPIIATAFDLLTIIAQRNDIERNRFSRLLLSPFWSAGNTELDSRARLEVLLRRGSRRHATLTHFERSLRNNALYRKIAPVALSRHMNALLKASGTFNKHRPPSEWASQFRTALNTCGWLEEYHLSSTEFQTREAFIEETHRLESLDPFVGKLSAMHAMTLLKRLCSERIFQAQTRGQPAIQILGILEAAGLSFDALWVSGMNDHVWPPPARPNPLLSAEQQRRYQTPNASAPVQTAFAKRVFDRLREAAPQVIFSWAQRENASELQPSPLLSGLPYRDPALNQDACWGHVAANAGGQALAAPMSDTQAPALTAQEHVRGGTGVLKAQAICPAWAYYQYRLGAQAMDDGEEGLDASQRGQIVHDALEHFWQQVGGSQALKKLPVDQRTLLIADAVSQALLNLENTTGQEALPTGFRQLEQQRVCRLLGKWLDFEAERPEDFTVIGTEVLSHPVIRDVAFTMRLDRIDRLANGQRLVIDYKTGASIDIKNWATDRITEPQLPIYAALEQPQNSPEEAPVTGVLFAKVVMHNPAMTGVIEPQAIDANDNTTGQKPNNPNALDSKALRRIFPEDRFPDWESVLLHWQTRIEAVVDELKGGDASVRFNNANDLRYCPVLPILRLSERQNQLLNLNTPE